MEKIMKYISILYLGLMVLTVPTLAKETTAFRYFGVNSEITQTDDPTIYEVHPNGEGANEGVVFTSEVEGGETIRFEPELKGSSPVYLKIEETDARGTYIKETVSKPYTLTEEWQNSLLETSLSSNTKQVDFMVLTVNQSETPFFFKTPKIDIQS